MSNATDYNTIPTQLKDQPRWIFWQYQTKNNGLKTKPPVSVDGRLVDVHQAANLYSFSFVKQKFNPQIHQGIGFCLTDSGYIGIDIDNCLQVPGQADSLKDWAVPILQSLAGNYTEISPSGLGLKTFIKGYKPDWMDQTHIKRGDGKVEIHDLAKYMNRICHIS